jgi:hypothetical protein
MKNIKNKKFTSEGFKIDVDNPADVEYMHQQFPWLSYEEIIHAIKTHGADPDSVRTFLENKKKSSYKD